MDNINKRKNSINIKNQEQTQIFLNNNEKIIIKK